MQMLKKYKKVKNKINSLSFDFLFLWSNNFKYLKYNKINTYLNKKPENDKI